MHHHALALGLALAIGPCWSAQAPTPPAPAPATTPAPAPATAKPPAPADAGDRPALGIEVDINFDGSKGVPVKSVVGGGTAAQMGLQPGDLIRTLNGKPVHSDEELSQAVAQTKVGDQVTLDITRGGEAKTLTGVMRERALVKQLDRELQELREEVARLRAMAGTGKRDPSLAEVLQQLGELEQQLPKAVEQFKRQYPNGDFKISVAIDIVSDRTAKNPIEVVPPDQGGVPLGGGQGAAPKPADAGKAEPAKAPDAKRPAAKP